MRVVSYNILDGGEGRADPLAEVIIAQKPDIVALVECDNVDVLNRIASRLSMDFAPAQGRKHATAILSRASNKFLAMVTEFNNLPERSKELKQ